MALLDSPWSQFFAIVLATFGSEDLTSIGVGLLVREGRVPLALGVIACTVGNYLGDLGLWAIGRLAGRRVLAWPIVARRLPRQQIDRCGAWFQQRGWQAVIAARFLPGARLPVYFLAGTLGATAGRFSLWAFLAAAIWTPLLVLLVAVVGGAVVAPLESALHSAWLAIPLATCLLFVAWRMAVGLADRRSRQAFAARVARIWRWEFWPSWLFYLPLVPWWIYLALRYRGLLVWTAANPGIPAGGVVGESKAAILENLPAAAVLPYLLVHPAPDAERQTTIETEMTRRGWQFPLILKPDASQRGAGLKLARSTKDVADYVARHPAALLAQVYHPGPFEAGIFYFRRPGEARGHIFSITDKRFPEVVGDGCSTLANLVWAHPRFCMQARTFLARHAAEADRVLAAGETMRLAVAGNHCQGTMFCDGGHLITPALEKAIDDVARRFRGFYIGRFDVRYTDVEKFRAGEDLAIAELNGVTSESTNIYDPSWSLPRAYRTLFRQWRLLFEIGAANRRLGSQPERVRALFRSIREFYSQRQVNPLAD